MFLLESLIDCLFGGENGPCTIIRNTSFRREPFSVKRPFPTERVGGLNYCVFDILISHQAPFKSFTRGRDPTLGGCILADVRRPDSVAFSYGFSLDGRPLGIFLRKQLAERGELFGVGYTLLFCRWLGESNFDQARRKLANRGHSIFKSGHRGRKRNPVSLSWPRTFWVLLPTKCTPPQAVHVTASY
jgi:hypothetical protein